MSAVDRILASFEALVGLFTRRLPAAFVWSYRVDSATETHITARRISPDCPFEDMPEIPLTPGIAGAGFRPAVGSTVLVAFLDGDPAKPRIVGADQVVPVSVTVDASGVIHLAPTTTGTVQVGDDSAPNAQAVALAPAVTSFANSAITVINASSVVMVAIGTFATAAGGAVPALVTPAATLNTAIGVYTGIASNFASTVGGLIGNWPTGFTSTKTSTK